MDKLPPEMHSQCVALLMSRYDGLGFNFEIDTSWGTDGRSLRIYVTGSREDLTRHAFVTEEQWSRVPKCGVAHAVAGIWVLRKFAKYWRMELVDVSGKRSRRARHAVRSELHYRLMAELTGGVAELDPFLVDFEKRELGRMAGTVSDSQPKKDEPKEDPLDSISAAPRGVRSYLSGALLLAQDRAASAGMPIRHDVAAEWQSLSDLIAHRVQVLADRMVAGTSQLLATRAAMKSLPPAAFDAGSQGQAVVLSHPKFDRAPVHQPHPRLRRGTLNLAKYRHCRTYKQQYDALKRSIE